MFFFHAVENKAQSTGRRRSWANFFSGLCVIGWSQSSDYELLCAIIIKGSWKKEKQQQHIALNVNTGIDSFSAFSVSSPKCAAQK